MQGVRRRGFRPQYGEQHQRMARDIVALHRDAYGDWCPGLDDIVQAHPSRDLVADHDVAGDLRAGLTVRCRSCNSKRQSVGLG